MRSLVPFSNVFLSCLEYELLSNPNQPIFVVDCLWLTAYGRSTTTKEKKG